MVSAPPPPRLAVVGATGWYGKTLIYEYARAYGDAAAEANLRLYASRPARVNFDLDGRSLSLPVEDLAEARRTSLSDFDGLLWYAFILKNKLPGIGADAYRRANDGIAGHVFSCLDSNPNLRTVFFSSGAALGLGECPPYDADPYAHLKITYERELGQRGPLITLYPYATLGKFVPDHLSFAAASFIHQAVTTGRIVIEAKMPVVRSYGSVHDFSRLLLRLCERPDWASAAVPNRIVPVTHTLELNQLAREVATALGREIDIVSATQPAAPASIYATSDFSYGAQLNQFGVTPTGLAQQLQQMSMGPAFQNAF